jgi:hypothetical protein
MSERRKKVEIIDSGEEALKLLGLKDGLLLQISKLQRFELSWST